MQAGEKNTRGSNDALGPGAAGERLEPPLPSSGSGQGTGGREGGREAHALPFLEIQKQS